MQKENKAPAAQPGLEKEKVIALIKLYQSQIPEEEYNWEEHVRDLNNIIFDIENNLKPKELPFQEWLDKYCDPHKQAVPVQQGADDELSDLPGDAKEDIFRSAQESAYYGGYDQKTFEHAAGWMWRVKQEQIKALQSQIRAYRTVLGRVEEAMSPSNTPRAFQKTLEDNRRICRQVLNEYPSGSK